MKTSVARLHRITLLQTFVPAGGFMYRAPILLGGDTSDEPLRSRLLLFEGEQPLRRAHEQHSVIAGTGRGAYSHWQRDILFSTSDNSDPNKNSRTYSYAIDHTGQHESQGGDLVVLNSPFYLQRGLCWGVAVLHQGDDVTSGSVSTLRLFEDERPLGPSHEQHPSIAERGGGAFSHWKKYLYFSTSDGSDPNTNGRLYQYAIEK